MAPTSAKRGGGCASSRGGSCTQKCSQCSWTHGSGTTRECRWGNTRSVGICWRSISSPSLRRRRSAARRLQEGLQSRGRAGSSCNQMIRIPTRKTGELGYKTGDLAHKTGDLAHKAGDLVIRQGTSLIRQRTPLMRQGTSLTSQVTSLIRQGTSLIRQSTLLIRQGTSLKRQGTSHIRQVSRS